MYEPFSPRFVSSIEANRTLKDELIAALARQSSRRRVSVTDLVNLRQAYFRRTRPDIEIPLARRQLLWAGTGFHQLFGAAVSTEEFLEQFVEWEGIVGKIDIYKDVPSELKTTMFRSADLMLRPSYTDQLAAYCVMVDREEGRILLYERAVFGRPPALFAYGVRFANLAAVAGEMRRRRDLLVEALETGDPSRLPRCEWWGRGCDYTDVCGCQDAPSPTRLVGEDDLEIWNDDRLAADLLAQLEAPERRGFGIHDLVFPRKSLVERQTGPDAEEELRPEVMLGSLERRGFQLALSEALHFGVPGAFTSTRVQLRSLRDVVRTFRGTPTILRVSRFAEMVERDRLPEVQTHFFDRLAFDCALSGHHAGRLLLYYENIPGDKFMIYDVRFRDIDRVAAEADRRLYFLETGGPLSELPACPPWMSKFCSIAPACGCGEPLTPSDKGVW